MLRQAPENYFSFTVSTDRKTTRNELKTIRWKQRFHNLNKAFRLLERGLAIQHPSDIEQQGIIQSFEFTCELSWKTLKDYLEAQGVACQFPREGIKKAFQYEIIHNGETGIFTLFAMWFDMGYNKPFQSALSL